MADFNTFIVASTVNTPHSVFPVWDRWTQTLGTLESIKRYAPGSKIVFIDNSPQPLTDGQRAVIGSAVDLYVDYRNNLFTKAVNRSGFNKGLNELLQVEAALGEAHSAGLIGRRIFKISGRYRLNSSFNGGIYLNPEYTGKYAFKITHWMFHTASGPEYMDFFCTSLWSMCGSLYSNYLELMEEIFRGMLPPNGTNIEVGHNKCIPRDKLVLIDTLGVEGYMAGGEFTSL